MTANISWRFFIRAQEKVPSMTLEENTYGGVRAFQAQWAVHA
jgi:hypothetical protein